MHISERPRDARGRLLPVCTCEETRPLTCDEDGRLLIGCILHGMTAIPEVPTDDDVRSEDEAWPRGRTGWVRLSVGCSFCGNPEHTIQVCNIRPLADWLGAAAPASKEEN